MSRFPEDESFSTYVEKLLKNKPTNIANAYTKERIFIDKNTIKNHSLAKRFELFEIIEGDIDTMVRFYSTNLYMFSIKTNGLFSKASVDQKKEIYSSIVNVLLSNYDCKYLSIAHVSQLHSIRDIYFKKEVTEDAFILGKAMLENIFKLTRESQ